MFIYEIFPRLGEIYFGELLGRKIFREANIQNEWQKLEEKLLSFAVLEHTKAWFSFYVWWEFYIYEILKNIIKLFFMSSLLTSRQKIIAKNF